MKKIITPEMILDELSENPHKYPTKEDWLAYISNLAHSKFDDAMLNKIVNGESTEGSDEALAKYHGMMINLGEKVWDLRISE